MTNQKRTDGPIEILFVEDNPGDVRLTEEAFKETGISVDIHSVSRGQAALDYLRQHDDESGSRPDVVLLDLYLPGMSGMEFLAELKSDLQLESIPVIVLTNSQDMNDMSESLENDALAYFAKPFGQESYDELANTLASFLIDISVSEE